MVFFILLAIKFYLTTDLWGGEEKQQNPPTIHIKTTTNFRTVTGNKSCLFSERHFVLIKNKLLLLGLHSVFQNNCIQYLKLKMTQTPFKPKTLCMVEQKV